MSESLQPTQPNNVGSIKSSIDDNGDLKPALVKVYDSTAVDIEKQRDDLNKSVTASKLHNRALAAQPSQMTMML